MKIKKHLLKGPVSETVVNIMLLSCLISVKELLKSFDLIQIHLKLSYKYHTDRITQW